MSIQYGDDRNIFKVCYIQKQRLHREDGPAIIYKNGKEAWFLNGVNYSIEAMPLNLFISYCKWEYKKNGN